MSVNKTAEPALGGPGGSWGPPVPHSASVHPDSYRILTREIEQIDSLRKIWEIKPQEKLQFPKDPEFRIQPWAWFTTSLLIQTSGGTNFHLFQQDPLSICVSQRMILWLHIKTPRGVAEKPDPNYFQTNTQETGNTHCPQIEKTQWLEGLFLNILWILIYGNVYLILRIIHIF